jgi:3-oxoadipate enol-lactonase
MALSSININGVNIYYELKGKQEGKEAVVFLNGLMSSVSGWGQQVPPFEKAGYKILLHDFRGQLLSAKPAELYTFSQHALDLKELLIQLGIERIHIVSTSYGALVGMRFVLDFPNYVQSFAMIDAFSELDSTFQWIADAWLETLKEGDMAKLFRAAVPAIYSNFFLEKNKESLREREAMMSKVPGDFVEALGRLINNTLTNAKITAELSNIKCPVLLVVGEYDQLTPLKFSKLIQKQIPHAEFVIVPECGHTTIYEKPDVVNSMTLGFISKYT